MLRVKHWLKFKYKFRYEFERFFYFYVQASKTNSLLLLSRLQNPLLNPISIEALEIHLSGAPWGMGQNPLVVTIFGEEKNLHFLQLIYSTLLGARILIHIHIKHVQKKRQEIYPTVSSHMVGLTVPLCRHKKIRNTVPWLIIMFESSCCYKLWVRFGDEPRYNVFGDIFHHASIYHGSG